MNFALLFRNRCRVAAGLAIALFTIDVSAQQPVFPGDNVGRPKPESVTCPAGWLEASVNSFLPFCQKEGMVVEYGDSNGRTVSAVLATCKRCVNESDAIDGSVAKCSKGWYASDTRFERPFCLDEGDQLEYGGYNGEPSADDEAPCLRCLNSQRDLPPVSRGLNSAK